MRHTGNGRVAHHAFRGVFHDAEAAVVEVERRAGDARSSEKETDERASGAGSHVQHVSLPRRQERAGGQPLRRVETAHERVGQHQAYESPHGKGAG